MNTSHRMPLIRLSACALVTLLAGRAPAFPGDDAATGADACLQGRLAAPALASTAFDPQTGRDPRNYPPHPLVDYKRMRLDLTIDDMNTARMDAVQTLTFAPIATELDSLSLDARLFKVKSVACDGHTTTFTHDGRKLTITFDPPLAPDTDATLITTYVVERPPYGIVWTPAAPDDGRQWAQVHTKNEPEEASYWFPCHDFPNDRLATEIVATVPGEYVVVSNGRLVASERRVGMRKDASGRQSLAPVSTYHWVQEKPHVNYLVCLDVGRWDVVDVGTPKLSMPVYAPVGRGGDVQASYGRTAAMIAFFEKTLDEPFPWDKYAQVIVSNFSAGGMEHTSATTMYEGAIRTGAQAADRDLDGLISHELAHQWFGDWITCNSWEHIWINEGFATYMTALWFEHRDGADAYAANIRSLYDGVIRSDTGSIPGEAGFASKLYSQPNDVFRRKANPYGKGASVLHMLRSQLGDQAFFAGLHLLLNRRAEKTAETIDVQRAFEDVSGQDLEQFFAQWVYRPGVPRLTADIAWSADDHAIKISLAQTQTIDADNPAFAFDLPVLIASQDGTQTRAVMHVNTKEASASFPAEAAPLFVALDPDLTVLADLKITQAPGAWVAQAAKSGSFGAAIQAVRALANDKSTAGADVLENFAFDKSAPDVLRVAAVRALQHRHEYGRMETVVIGRPNSGAVREAAINAISVLASRRTDNRAESYKARVVNLLTAAIDSDASDRARAAAIRGLGRLKQSDALPLFMKAMNENSADDVIRQAAIRALADLDGPQGLAVALQSAKATSTYRTRVVAIECLPKLAHLDPDGVTKALTDLLNDPYERVWKAAGKALTSAEPGIVQDKALAAIKRMSESAPDPSVRTDAAAWAKAIEDRAAKDGQAAEHAKPAGDPQPGDDE